MDVGQKVKITKSLDLGKEGEVIKLFTKSVPPAILQIGGDDKPMPYCIVTLDDGHTNQYPIDWVEAV